MVSSPIKQLTLIVVLATIAITIAVVKPKTLTAEHRHNPATITPTLTINVVGDGVVTVSPPGTTFSGTVNQGIGFTAGTTVTLTARPAENWRFDQWESTALITTPQQNPLTHTVTTNTILTATFTRDYRAFLPLVTRNYPPPSISYVSQVGGESYGVAIKGDYAYLGEGAVLTILNIADPQHPTLITRTTPFSGGLLGAVISGTHLHLTGRGGWHILDISRPENPQLRATVPMTGGAFGIALSGTYAYVGNFAVSGVLRIFDIANVDTPKQVGHIAVGDYLFGVTVAGHYAYLAKPIENGIRIVDIADPANPVETGRYIHTTASMQAIGVAVEGSAAFIADYESGVHVLDVNNPFSPTHLGQWPAAPSSTHAVWVAIHNHQLYVAGGVMTTGTLSVFDISNPANLTEIGSTVTAKVPGGIALSGSHGYIPFEDGGLQIADISRPENPVALGLYDTPGGGVGITANGTQIYVAEGYNDRVTILDASNLNLPQAVSVIDVAPYYAYVPILDSPYLYIGHSGGLDIANVSNPTQPFTVSRYLIPPEYGYQAAVMNLDIENDYAFLACGRFGLRILDIQNKTSPVELNVYQPEGWPYDTISDVKVRNHYAYVVDGNLSILDVTDPTNPQKIGEHQTPGNAWQLDLNDDYAYIADSFAGLRIINISDPTKPVEVAAFNPPAGLNGGVTDIVVADHYAFIAHREELGDTTPWYHSLRVLDVRDPTSPLEVVRYPVQHNFDDIAAQLPYIHIAFPDGLLTLEMRNN